MDKIQRHSAASLDETRVEYILAAVDSARQIFPSHVIKKKNAAEEKHHSSTKLSGEDISVAVNGQLLEEWTEEDTTNVNGFMEKRVSIFSVDGKYILPNEITGTISRDKKMMATSISKTLALHMCHALKGGQVLSKQSSSKLVPLINWNQSFN